MALMPERAEVQMVTYKADKLDHYDWHHDVQYGQSLTIESSRSRSN